MRPDLGDTDETKIRKSSARLLERLKEHHDYAVPIWPVAFVRAPVDIAPLVAKIMEDKPARPINICILPPDGPGPSIDTIKRAVCIFYGISHNDLVSARRQQKVVHSRQIAMYLAKELTPKSLPEIGRRFGYRDHTTVLHSVRKITALVENGHPLTSEVSSLREILSP